MKTQFILTDPDDLPFQCLKWLQISLDKTPGNTTLLSEALGGNGLFYVVRNLNEDISYHVGVIYLEWSPGALNIVLLGGDNIKEWRNEMHDFCVSLIREKGIKTIMFMGRYGLGKIFPQFKAVGMVYVLEDLGGWGTGTT